MINPIKLQCPNCGANLDINPSLKQCFCVYCGTKILLHNDNEYIVRIIDDAKIKEVELQHDLEVRKLQEQINDQKMQLETESFDKKQEAEAKEKQKKRIHRKRIVTVVITLLVGIVGIPFTGPLALVIALIFGGILFFKEIPEQEELRTLKEMGYAKYPKDVGNLHDREKDTFELELKNAGFINIAVESCHDMLLGISKKNGKVNRVIIDGKTPVPGKIYQNDVEVVIMYHGR